MTQQNIPNFDLLCGMLKDYMSASEEDATTLIIEMQNIYGYYKWLDWMEKNRPNELP